MEEHPTELLPGYVLEALSPEEARLVAAHLRRCPACQAEAASFRAVVNLLPYTAAAHDPPPHVKQQLFARIGALEHTRPPEPPRPRRSAPPSPPARLPRWAVGALAGACALVLGLGTMSYDMNRRLQAAEAALSSLDQSGVSAFLVAPDTQSRELHTALPGLRARMFMRPGHRQAVLIVNGLPAPAADHIYRFWFARDTTLVPARTFSVGQSGAVALLIDAPEPVDSYRQVMVTQEPSGGDGAPSDDVVLEASL